jgi:hypothetical protein
VVARGDRHPTTTVRDSSISGKGLFSVEPVLAGTTLFEISGTTTAIRSSWSFQIDFHRHIESASIARYMNHSCDPSCGLHTTPGEILLVVALKDLDMNEEVTIDYATFEYERPAGPISCACGSAQCRGVLTGYSELTAGQQLSLARYALPYMGARTD